MQLKPHILRQIINFIVGYKPVEKIVLFGSRAQDKAKQTSDIDLAIFSKKWTSRDFNLVKNGLEEKIPTPLKFDVVNFYKLSRESLKKEILTKGRVIYGS